MSSPSFEYQSPYKPTPTSTPLDKFVRSLRLRIYRIEVTYGVYVYTPTEKVIFWMLFCLLFSAISTFVVLYIQRILVLCWRILVVDSHVVARLLTAKQAAAGLTTSASTADAENAMEMIGGLARNSQVA
ncbi:hypothetical protein F5Y08DRAFT_315624 [Xylaria arbuscula]|nr:hypothetical protein F5Y08DRAFT_315624 [Xylaria arbuscula]